MSRSGLPVFYPYHIKSDGDGTAGHRYRSFLLLRLLDAGHLKQKRSIFPVDAVHGNIIFRILPVLCRIEHIDSRLTSNDKQLVNL